MVCLMCADTSEVLLGLETHKYRPKPSNDALRSSVRQKAARIGPCKFLGKMKKFLQNFQISKIDDFHSKSLNFAENHRNEVLSHRAPEDTIRKDFVHTFKFLNRRAPQKYLHTPGTPYVSAKNSISTFFPYLSI